MRAFLAATLATLFAVVPVYGDILLDELQRSASVESPLMSGNFVDTQDVGELDAQRLIRILGSTTDPVGTLDIGGRTRSVLTADLVTVNPRDRASIGFQSWYDFDTTDLSEGGQNDAILIDFIRTRTNGTPLSTRAFIGRANATVETPSSDEPFTLAIPFAAIGADFSQVSSLNFTFSTPELGGGADFDLFVEIDRIRIGQIIPEPTGLCMLVIAGVCLGGFRSRRREVRTTSSRAIS